MSLTDVIVRIVGKDETKQATDSVAQGMSQLAGAGDNMGKSMLSASGLTQNLMGSLSGLALKVLPMVTAALSINAIKNYTMELVSLGAATQAMQGKFDTVFKQYSISVQENLRDFAVGAGRSKIELQGMASSAQDMFVPMGFARDVAADLSATVSKMAVHLGSFNDIADMEAFGALRSTLIGNHESALRFGVIINEASLQQELMRMGADDLTGSLLNEAKVLARMNLLIAGNSDALGINEEQLRATGGESYAASEYFQEMINTQGDAIRTAHEYNNTTKAIAGSMADLKNELGLTLIPIGTTFLNAYKSIMPGVQNLQAGITSVFKNLVGVVLNFGKSFLAAFGINFETVGAWSGPWGKNIVMQFARGMAAGMMAVVNVLKQLGGIISHWLQPHSPPLITPDLDVWGKESMSVYLRGWGDADFGLFDEVVGTMSQYIEQLYALGDGQENSLNLANRILDLRTAMIQVGSDFNVFKDTTDLFSNAYQTGMFENVTATEEWQSFVSDAISEIEKATGTLPEDFSSYLEVMFNAQAAAEMVAEAQKEINDLTKEFAEALAPLNAELKAIQDQKDAINNAKKLADLQTKLQDDSLDADARRLIQLDIQEMQIKAQIKDVEKERDLELAKANEKLNSAQTLQQRLNLELETQKKLLDIGIQNTSQQTEIKNLMIEIAQAAAEMGAGLTEAAEDMAKGMGGAMEGMTEAIAGLGESGDYATGLVGVFDDLFADVDKEFEPLNTAFEELGTQWAGIFKLVDFSESVNGAKSFFADLQLDIENFYNYLTTTPISQIIQDSFEGGSDIFSFLFESAVEGLSLLGTELQKVDWEAVKTSVLGVLESMFLGFVEIEISILKGWRTFFENIGDTIGVDFRGMIEKGLVVLDKIGTFLKWLGQTVVDTLAPSFATFKKEWAGLSVIAEGFLPILDRVWEAIKKLATIIGGILIAGLVAGVAIITSIFSALMKAIIPLIQTVSLVVARIMLAFEGLVNYFDHLWKAIAALFNGDFDAMWEHIAGAQEGIKEFFLNIVLGVRDLVVGVFSTIMTFIIGFVEGIGNFIGNAFANFSGEESPIYQMRDSIKTGFDNMLQIVWDWAFGIGEMLRLRWEFIQAHMTGAIQNMLLNIYLWVENTKASMTQWATDVYFQITNFITTTYDSFILWKDNILFTISEFVFSFIEKIITFGLNFYQNVADFLAKIKEGWALFIEEVLLIIKGWIDSIKEKWENIKILFTNLKTWWDELKTKAADALADIVTKVVLFGTTITTRFDGIKEKITSLTEKWTTFRDFFKGVWDILYDAVFEFDALFAGVVDGLIIGISNMSERIGELVQKFADLLNLGGGGSITPPEVPAYALGGWVPRTEMALVHANEYVLSEAMLRGQQLPDMSVMSMLSSYFKVGGNAFASASMADKSINNVNSGSVNEPAYQQTGPTKNYQLNIYNAKKEENDNIAKNFNLLSIFDN